MADPSASLAVHSITEGNSIKVSKDLNANAVANPIYTEITDGVESLAINTDGSINVSFTSGSIIKIQDNDGDLLDLFKDGDTFTAVSDFGIGILGQDGSNWQVVHVDTNGDLQVDVVGPLPAGTNDIGSIHITDGTDSLAITTGGSAQIDIAEQSLIAVKISKDANANSETNPIFVQLASGTSGTEIHDFNQAVAVAGGGSNSHTYSVGSGKTFLLKRVIVAASGGGRWEVQVGPTISKVTKAVKFSSMAQPNQDFVFDPPIEIVEAAGGEGVFVVRKNREGAAQDLYSTIIGNEI